VAGRDIPNLKGKTDPSVELAIRELYNHVYSLRDSKANVKETLSKQSMSSTLDNIQRQIAQNPSYSLLEAGDSTPLKNGQGSVLPIIVGALAYTNGGNNIDWSGTGLQALWPNQEVDNLPTFSQPTAGLALSTAYFFYPRVNLRTTNIELAAPSGGVGTPLACAFTARNSVAAAMQTYDGYVGISIGGITASTTGGGAGPGGSGGGSGCIWEQMVAETPQGRILPMSNLWSGDYVMGPSGPNLITRRTEVTESEWIIIKARNGEKLVVTPTHSMSWRGLTKHACDWSLSDLLVGREDTLVQIEYIRHMHKRATAVFIECVPDHRFYFGERTAFAESHNLPVGK
jgi:hypothetical protein